MADSAADRVVTHLTGNWSLGTTPEISVLYETKQIRKPKKNTIRVTGAREQRIPKGYTKELLIQRLTVFINSPTDGLADDFRDEVARIMQLAIGGIDYSTMEAADDSSRYTGKTGLGSQYSYTGTIVLETLVDRGNPMPLAPAGGSGTTNYIAKWTGADTLGNSQLVDDATDLTAALAGVFKLQPSGVTADYLEISTSGAIPQIAAIGSCGMKLLADAVEAFIINASGEITKIGQDTPSTSDFLQWDGSKVVWTAGGATDADAIHDNVADEIHQVTLKGTPVAADELLIEDSAASWAKKRIAISTLPAGSPSFGSPTGNIDIGDAAVEGVSTDATRADHQHQFSAPGAGYPLDVAESESDGTATTPARSDHVHAHGSGYLANAHHNQSHTAADHSDVSGTQNTIPKFGASSALGDSQVTDDGTDVTATLAGSLIVQVGGETADYYQLLLAATGVPTIKRIGGSEVLLESDDASQICLTLRENASDHAKFAWDKTLNRTELASSGVVFLQVNETGDIIKIGQDTPSTDDVLAWDGSKAVWVPPGASDADAIHDNVDQEIQPIAVKGTPVSADVLLIEDSAATWAKKSVTIGSLPAGSPSFGVPTGDIDIGDSAAEGSSGDATRADHQHAFSAPGAGYPVQIDIGDAQADGTATTPARSDHGHAFPAPGAGYPVDVAATEDDGTATTPARSDHRHAHGTGYSADAHHNQAHDIEGSDHTLTGGTAGEYLRADGATTFSVQNRKFSVGACVVSPATGYHTVWRAPVACTVTEIQGRQKGGTSTVINARKSGSTDVLTSDLTLTSADTWYSSTSVQNTAYAVDDWLEVEVVTVGGATEITIQVEFTEP